jgi:hypothetical protein
VWATACKRVGLDGKLFHDLCRSEVRNLVRAGVRQAVAKKISGHKTDSVFNRSNIMSETDLVDGAQKLDRHLVMASAQTDGHKMGTIATGHSVEVIETGGSSSGRTSDFGSDYPGSNPGPPATLALYDRQGGSMQIKSSARNA